MLDKPIPDNPEPIDTPAIKIDPDSPIIALPDTLLSRSTKGNKITVYLRQQVVEALIEVNQTLVSHGVRLLIRDGLRTTKQQDEMWQSALKAASGNETIAEQYAARPYQGVGAVPPHMTGGAVDLTLCSQDDETPLTMSHPSPIPDHRDATSYCETADISQEPWAADAQKNRRLLFNAMREHGFMNYAAEWWHYELGTKAWATWAGASSWYELPK